MDSKQQEKGEDEESSSEDLSRSSTFVPIPTATSSDEVNSGPDVRQGSCKYICLVNWYLMMISMCLLKLVLDDINNLQINKLRIKKLSETSIHVLYLIRHASVIFIVGLHP